MESILSSIKKMLGIEAEYTQFDQELIIYINSVFSVLKQLGVKDKNFSIVSDSSTWYDYFEDDEVIEMIKPYIYMKVRLMFDPPSSSAVIEVINNQISEFEWRLKVESEQKEDEDV